MKLTFDIDRAVAVEQPPRPQAGRDRQGGRVRNRAGPRHAARACWPRGSAPLFMPQLLGYELTQFDLARANGMLQASGTGACAEAVGKALGAFLRRIEREAA